MAIIRRTKEERQKARQVVREERKKFKELPKDVRQDIRSSERYDNKRERKGARITKALAKTDAGRTAFYRDKENPTGVVDPGYTKTKPITVLMKGTTTDRGNDGRLYTNPESVEAYSSDNSQDKVAESVRAQINYKASQGEIDNVNIQAQANSVPTAGMQLASAVANDPNATLTDLNKLPQATTAVNNTQNQQDAAIADDAIATNNAVAETPDAEVPVVGAEVAVNDAANAGQGAVGAGGGTTDNTAVGGDGSMINQQIQGGGATFDQGMNRGNIQDQVTSGAFKGFTNSPVTAIEKLGVQDYFPNAGESINVGSYSGKYIGNTTIFAAPGARIPFGLYDARMRALKEAAADKQKAIDAILNSPETSPQYQEQLDDSFFGEDGVQMFIDKHGNNPDAILNDPEFRKWMANKQAKARDITQAVTFAKTTLDEYAKTGSYIPDKVRDVSMKLLYGQAPDFKEYLEGTGTLSKLVEDNVVYMNIFPQVQEYAKTALSPDRLTQSPISMKSGGKYDSKTFDKERSEFMTRVMDGTVVQGTDVYASGIAKYFTGDYEASIRAIAAGQNASEEQVEEAIKMFTGMIPKESIIFDYTTIKTDELGYDRLTEARRQYNTTREDKNASYWATMNEMQTDLVNEQTGISANQNLINIQKKGLKGAELDKAMENHYRTYGIGAVSPNAKVEKDDNGVYVTRIPASKKSQDGKLTAVADPNSKTFVVQVYDKDADDWVPKNLTAAQISNSGKPMKVGGKNLTSDQKRQYGDAAGSMYSRVVSYDVKQAFTDNNGNHKYLTAGNVAEYNASQQKYTYAIPVERQFARSVKPNTITGKPEYVDVALPGQTYGTAFNINNRADAMTLDEQSGYGSEGSAEAVDGGTTVTVSGGSEATTTTP